MSSYKPVIYAFGAIGLLATLGLMLAANQLIKTGADYTDINDRMASSSTGYPDYSQIRQEDPTATEIDDQSPNTGAIVNTTTPLATSDDSYLGTRLLYSTMQDPKIMNELKLRDDIDPAFKALLTRADSSFQELYHSDTKIALKMLALDESIETILVQDLTNGTIYDTKINAHANFKFIGPQIVHLVTGTKATDVPGELIQARVYNIETNQTKNETPLALGSSYTKMLDQFSSPIATMKVTNGKIETTIYSTKDNARFDTERAAVRTVSFPSGR